MKKQGAVNVVSLYIIAVLFKIGTRLEINPRIIFYEGSENIFEFSDYSKKNRVLTFGFEHIFQ